jgi:hypothetical protein
MDNSSTTDPYKFVRYALVKIPDGVEPCVENATEALAIDVFPHRLNLKTSLDDHIMGLIWECWFVNRDPIETAFEQIQSRVEPSHPRQVIEFPYARMHPGSIILSLGLQGASKPIFVNSSHLYALDGKKYPFPGGQDFIRYLPERAGRPRSYMEGLDGDTRMQIMLALIASLLPMKVEDRAEKFDLACAVLARISRHVDIGTPAGAAGSAKAVDNFHTLFRDFQLSWDLLPDRPWAPTCIGMSKQLQKTVSTIPQDIINLADELTDIATFPDMEGLKEFATTGARESASNHQLLNLKGLVGKIDKAIIRLAPEADLKPAAARKRAALVKKKA